MRLVDANLVIAFFLNWSWVAFRGQLSGFTAPQLAQKILFRLKRPANELPRVAMIAHVVRTAMAAVAVNDSRMCIT